MKFAWLAALVCIVSMAGCGSEDEDSIFPGYIKPGDFRPKGMLVKEYTLTDAAFIPDGDNTCTGEECLAVYAFWLVNNFPVEGVAIKSGDTVDSRLLMKFTRVPGGPWTIKLTYKGIEYTTAPGGTTNLDLDVCRTTFPTFPAYTYDPTPAIGDEVIYNESDSFLSRATLTVTAAIPLQNEAKTATINLNTGDEIVAQAFNAFTSAACP